MSQDNVQKHIPIPRAKARSTKEWFESVFTAHEEERRASRRSSRRNSKEQAVDNSAQVSPVNPLVLPKVDRMSFRAFSGIERGFRQNSLNNNSLQRAAKGSDRNSLPAKADVEIQLQLPKLVQELMHISKPTDRWGSPGSGHSRVNSRRQSVVLSRRASMSHRRDSRRSSVAQSRRGSNEPEGDADGRRRKSVRRLTLKDLVDGQGDMATFGVQQTPKTAERSFAALQATAVATLMTDDDDDHDSHHSSSEDLLEPPSPSRLDTVSECHTEAIPEAPKSATPTRASPLTARRTLKIENRDSIIDAEEHQDQKRGKHKHKRQSGFESEHKLLDQKSTSKENNPETAAVDKRLLMMRNARLIQQVLQEIKDEATKCHDRWLKRKPGQENVKKDINASLATSSSTSHRLSFGMKPLDERSEDDARKTAGRLRRKRGQKIRQRLNMLHPDVAEAVARNQFESWTSRATLADNVSSTVKERFERHGRQTFSMPSPIFPVAPEESSSSSESSGLSNSSSSDSEDTESSSEEQETESSGLEDANSPTPPVPPQQDQQPRAASAEQPRPLPPDTATRPTRVWTAPAMSRMRMALRQLEIGSASPHSAASPTEALDWPTLESSSVHLRREGKEWEQPLPPELMGSPFTVEQQRPATTPSKQREALGWMMQEVERHRALLSLAANDLMSSMTAAERLELGLVSEPNVDGKLEGSEERTTSSFRASFQSTARSSDPNVRKKKKRKEPRAFNSNVSTSSRKTVRINPDQKKLSKKESVNKGSMRTSGKMNDSSNPASPRGSNMRNNFPSNGSLRRISVSEFNNALKLGQHATPRSSIRAKARLPEVPRLRNRFRDRRFILGDHWRNKAQTLKRYHQQVAERLGLDENDWLELKTIYHVNVGDMLNAASRKLELKQLRAATLIQALWKGKVSCRFTGKQLEYRRSMYVRIQRWWRRMYFWVLPVRRRIELERPHWNKQATRIQAMFRGLSLRKRLAFIQECHSIKYKMQCLSEELGHQEVMRWSKVQAAARGWLARRKTLKMPLSRKSVGAPTCVLVPVKESADKEPGSRLRERRRSSLFIHPSAGLDVRRGTMHLLSPRYPGRAAMRRSSEMGERRASVFRSCPPVSGEANDLNEPPPLTREEECALAVCAMHSLVPTATLAPYAVLKESQIGKAVCDSVPLSQRRKQTLKSGAALMAGLSTKAAGKRSSDSSSESAPQPRSAPKAVAAPKAKPADTPKAKALLSPPRVAVEESAPKAQVVQDIITINRGARARRSVCIADDAMPPVLE